MLSKSIKYKEKLKNLVYPLSEAEGAKNRWLIFLLELAIKSVEQPLKNKGSNLSKTTSFLLGLTTPWSSVAYGFSFVKLL